jgi:hypothetical protein
MILTNNSKFIFSTLLVAASVTSMTHSAHASWPNEVPYGLDMSTWQTTKSLTAAPLAVQIGVSTCDSLRSKLRQSEESQLDNGDVWLMAKDANALVVGATSITARCSSNKVIALQVLAPKFANGKSSSREIFSLLKLKYRLIDGGPMPSQGNGNGCAIFAAGTSVIIEQDVPHLQSDFTVTYYEKGFHDSIVASSDKTNLQFGKCRQLTHQEEKNSENGN